LREHVVDFPDFPHWNRLCPCPGEADYPLVSRMKYQVRPPADYSRPQMHVHDEKITGEKFRVRLAFFAPLISRDALVWNEHFENDVALSSVLTRFSAILCGKKKNPPLVFPGGKQRGTTTTDSFGARN